MPTMQTHAYAAPEAHKPLAPTKIERREPGPEDVGIDILYCGVCHSDIHQVRDEWATGLFPMVPGHEIIGRVRQLGSKAKRLKVGDLVGVGCFVDSCRDCTPCKDGFAQFCTRGCAFTYNSTEMDRKTRTYGGYSTAITVAESYVLKVPESLDPAAAAPLLCAGITTYSPLREWNCKAGDRVGVVGLGGLGHMAVKLAASMGAEVTVLSTSSAKEADAKRLGAHNFVVTREAGAFKKLRNHFNIIIDTVSAEHDYNDYLGALAVRGTMAVVGIPTTPSVVRAFNLINGNRRLVGSNIGGIAETQEMLDYCGDHKVVSDIEMIAAKDINNAYERMLRSDVRYRFVIDSASLR